MRNGIFRFEEDGREVLGFDTGLTSRAFAQAKLSGLISEPGFIVRQGPDESGVELWNAVGVTETAADAGSPTMAVWGPVFDGERLDVLLAGNSDRALSAVIAWIQAILILEKDPSDGFSLSDLPLWPCAALIGSGTVETPPAVFFMPSGLAKRCLMTGETAFTGGEWYTHADLGGAAAIAFTAAAMLYRVFAGTPAFDAKDEIVVRQDIREGNFLPIRLAAPGLDGQLADFIQKALTPNVLKSGKNSSLRNGVSQNTVHPAEFLTVLRFVQQAPQITKALAVSVASMYHPIDDAGRLSLEKEKEQYIKIKTATVKTKRFIIRNTAIIFGCLAAFFAAAFFTISMVRSRAALPTTEGLSPEQVIETYYNSIGELNHHLTEACVTRKAKKNDNNIKGDINLVINLFVISRVRMAHEMNAPPHVLSANKWREMGEIPVESNILGVTDLNIKKTEGDESSGTVRFFTEYIFWLPEQMTGSENYEPQAGTTGETELLVFRPPVPFSRRDHLTLVKIKGNWHISEIIRKTDE